MIREDGLQGQNTFDPRSLAYEQGGKTLEAALEASVGARVTERLKEDGVRFGLYDETGFNERYFPFDPQPRVVSKDEFGKLEKGLIQRVTALNLFLKDIYNDALILRDNVVPKEFVYSSSGYLRRCENIVPKNGIYAHVAGIDLVQEKSGRWFILEDNLKIPSGASYPLIARQIEKRLSPRTFETVADTLNYGNMLKDVMDYVSCGGINVVLTPGKCNSAYFEHCYLAEKTGSALATSKDLFVENNVLYFKSVKKIERVGALYRRVADEFIDPLAFRRNSAMGVPNLYGAYESGNLGLMNALGNGAADDKGIYYFVPRLIEYYLGEAPILKNAPTYLPYYESDLKYVVSNLEKLVVKDVSESGGYGVVFAGRLKKEDREELKAKILKSPRQFIAQEIIDFIELDTASGTRKADLRAFVLSGQTCKVWAGGLTRFAGKDGSYVVNSSQGGGFKDTWVLSR